MITKNLAIGANFKTGKAVDLSAASHDFTVVNDMFTTGHNGFCATFKDNSGYAYAAHSTDFNLDAFTFCFVGGFEAGFNPSAALEYLVHKDWYVYNNAKNQIGVYDGNSFGQITFTDAQVKGCRTLILTKTSGSALAKAFINGIYVGELSGLSGALDMINGTSRLTVLGNQFGSAGTVSNLEGFLMYTDEKTPKEVALIHENMLKWGTPNVGVRNFSTPCSQDVMSSGSNWNMRVDQGKVNDLTGSNHGTPTAVVGTKTPWKEDALSFQQTNSEIDCGTASDLNFTTETFGGMCVTKSKLASSRTLFGNGAYNSNGYYYYLSGGVKPTLVLSQAGSTNVTDSSKTIPLNETVFTGFVSVAGDKGYIYVNGEEVTGTQPSRVDPVTANHSFRIGSLLGATPFVGDIARPICKEYASKEEYEKEYFAQWEDIKNKVLFREDFEYSHIHGGAQSVGLLEGTRWENIAGTMQIVTEDVLNEKDTNVLKFVISGSVAAIPYKHKVLGTWEFKAKRAASSNYTTVMFCCSRRGGYATTGQTGYALSLYADNSIRVSRVSGGILNTIVYAPSEGSVGDWSTYKITVDIDHTFSLYKDGVLIGTPAIDTNYSEGTYINLRGYSGDEVKCISHKFGA